MKLSAEMTEKVLRQAGLFEADVAPLPSQISEKEFQAAVIDLAKDHCWAVYHPYDSRKSEAGWPDLVLVRDRILYRELKVPPNMPTAAQLNWIDAINAAGGDAGVWRPCDWQTILEILTAKPEFALATPHGAE